MSAEETLAEATRKLAEWEANIQANLVHYHRDEENRPEVTIAGARGQLSMLIAVRELLGVQPVLGTEYSMVPPGPWADRLVREARTAANS